MSNIKKFKKLTLIIIVLIFCFVYTLHVLHKNKNNYNTDSNFKIDKAFVINLDRTPKRWEESHSVLLSSGLMESQIEKFSATDGLYLKILDYELNQFFTGRDIKENKVTFRNKSKYKIICSDDVQFDYIANKNHRSTSSSSGFLTAGEFGCTCSHLRAMKEAQKRGYKHILIFEDDVKKMSNQIINLNEYITKNTTALKSCNISYFYFWYNQKLINRIKNYIQKKIYNMEFFKYRNIFNAKYSLHNQFLTTNSYYADEYFMQTVLSLKDISVPVDWLYNNLIIVDKKVNACFSHPFIFNGGDDRQLSTISELGRSFN